MTTDTSLPELMGSDLEVPLATGETVRYVNLDCAASTPAMRRVAGAVGDVLPWYSSVHRGAGHASQVSTRLYEAARMAVGGFVGARSTDSVVLVRNTTEAINVLAHGLTLRPGQVVITTTVEHHANMLPWRRLGPVVYIAPPSSPAALINDLRSALRDHDAGVVAVTGASNVTGEVFPIADIATLCREHDVLLCVDAAQLAPHRAIDMAAMGIDCLALSGHKMYAPFGSGALIAPRERLRESEPLLAGGGAVDFVGLTTLRWADLPDRLEAGSPNVIGAVALGAACTALGEAGMDAIATHERDLLRHLRERLAGVAKIRQLQLWQGDDIDHLGVYTFMVDGMHPALVAAALSAEWGIGVRHGRFCAHPYIAHLLGITPEKALVIDEQIRSGGRPELPGAVRASFGIGTSSADIDRLADALLSLVSDGPRLDYVQDAETGDFTPVGDKRTWPRFDLLPPLTDAVHSHGCGQF